MVFCGPISSKKKSGIGRKQKNGSSFQRHKDAIAETEVVYQPPAETTSPETTKPPQKRQANNQRRVARGIVSRNKMVQQITMERDFLLAQNTSLQGHADKEKAATSQLVHLKFLDAKTSWAQIIWHQEEHVFSIDQLCFLFSHKNSSSHSISHLKCLFNLIVELKMKLSYGEYMLLLMIDDLSPRCLCIQKFQVN